MGIFSMTISSPVFGFVIEFVSSAKLDGEKSLIFKPFCWTRLNKFVVILS